MNHATVGHAERPNDAPPDGNADRPSGIGAGVY
jgi:hypothetical protein